MEENMQEGHESAFNEIISPYYPDIKKYCKSIASNYWETEDLFQDSLLKIYLAWKKKPDREITKKLLYTIIKNTWIDQKRKKCLSTEPLEEGIIQDEARYNEGYEIREVLEELAEYLSIKQFVIILLTEAFDFTAKETAALIKDSESNVYTTLHRTKKKLKRYLHLQVNLPQEKFRKKADQMIDPSLFENFLNGFRTKNPKLIYESYLSMNGLGMEIRKVRSVGKSICFNVTDPDGNVLMICT
ncbi:RNA polymerase sigma factor [Evansella clarkii]|uniref:RNA polymerase sigma factor n=1 Tax=Evansella clarkii TaxID=79879 RepID=UPI001472E8BE|nr:RNA polymerase sigma factor [Evansella clarkii]